MNVVLLSTYDLGHQSFGLASPAAWLKRVGANVVCNDLAVEDLKTGAIVAADLIALHVPMHTAARLSLHLLPSVTALNARALLVCYGMYAPANQSALKEAGVEIVLGGEAETKLVEIYQRKLAGQPVRHLSTKALTKQQFVRPDRRGLPDLHKYAHLLGPGNEITIAGYSEASRGCKHLCQHCPVVPAYGGRFFIVGVNVVLEDIDQQVEMGARHITFGDPDFFNGPGHAMRVVEALAKRHPKLTYDVTIKVEHLRRHHELLPRLVETGCLFVTTAVESFDDTVLHALNKGHSRSDFADALEICKAVGLQVSPTFVPFTPWTTPESYLDLLQQIVLLELVPRVAPIQLAIRLLVPRDSLLLSSPSFSRFLGGYDAESLSYLWHYADPGTISMEQEIRVVVEKDVPMGVPVLETFAKIWRVAHEAAGRVAPSISVANSEPVWSMSEPWYCCAEPTAEQFDRL